MLSPPPVPLTITFPVPAIFPAAFPLPDEITTLPVVFLSDAAMLETILFASICLRTSSSVIALPLAELPIREPPPIAPLLPPPPPPPPPPAVTFLASASIWLRTALSAAALSATTLSAAIFSRTALSATVVFSIFTGASCIAFFNSSTTFLSCVETLGLLIIPSTQLIALFLL